MSEATAGAASFAERVDQLFRTLRPSADREYAYDEVAAAMRKAGMDNASGNYIYMLRTGRRTNPSMRYVEALAKFFRVPVGYFSNDAEYENVSVELALAAALADSDVRSVALRARGLSRSSLMAIRDIITTARRIEGLPDDEVPEADPKSGSSAEATDEHVPLEAVENDTPLPPV